MLIMKIGLAICLILTLASCKKSSSTPDCIQLEIDRLKSTASLCDYASIKEFRFGGKLVYVISYGNCPDGVSGVVDRNCNSLGYLGGIAGNTKIDGVDFGANAQYKRTIWHN